MSTHSHRPSPAPVSESMCSLVASTPSSRPSSSWNPAIRVMHIDAGPCAPVPRQMFPELVAPFSEAARAQLERCGTDYDLLHANYWVSGAVGHRLKHELDLPLVTTFHSLDRVQAPTPGSTTRSRCGHASRPKSCAAPISWSRRPTRNATSSVRYYGADPERVEIVPPGVDASLFSPGDQAAARHALRLDAPPRAAVRRAHPAAQGRRPRDRGARPARRHRAHAPRGRRAERPAGRGRARARCTRSSRSSGVEARVRFVPPQPHDELADLLPRRRRVHRPVTLGVVRARRARSRRVRHAGRRRERSADCASSSTTAAPATSSTGAIPPTTPRRSTASCRGRARGPMGAARRRACRAATRWNIAAARLRRLYADLAAPCARRSALERARRTARRMRATRHALIAAHLEGPVADEPCVQTRRVRPGAPSLVRALRLRRPRRGHDLLRSAPTHAALRGVLPAAIRRRTTSSSTEFMLQRNHSMYGARFSIGPDGDLYLVGRVALEHLDVDRARSHHRRDLRARRAVVPAGRAPRLRSPDLTPCRMHDRLR